MDNAQNLLDLAVQDIANSKHLAVWNWLFECPLFTELFFIFDDGENGSVVMIPLQTVKDDVLKSYLNKTYIKAYDLIVSTVMPITASKNNTENIQFLNVVDGLSVWVEEQDEKKNYPLFGDGFDVQKVEVLTNTDGISALDEHSVKYQFNVRITYFDTTKKRGL